MPRNFHVWGLLALWALLMVLSYVIPRGMSPGMGLGAGLNRIGAFLGFQIGGACIAVILLFAARHLPTRGQQWLVRVPALVALALGLGIAGIVVAANMNRPEPSYTPPGPPTAPAMDNIGK